MDRTSDPPAPSASAPPSPTTAPPTASLTPPPTPSPTNAPVDLSFSSTIYPYRIVLPADGFTPGAIAVIPPPGTWKPATEMWDGSTAIGVSTPGQNDSTADTNGDALFVVGGPTGDDLDTFVARMINNFGMWHGCSRTPSSRAAEVDGVPAVLIGSPCSSGAGSAILARMFVVHDGFGFVFNLYSARPVGAGEQMDRLVPYVAGVDLLP